MPKSAISVTLAPDNILWLKARARASGGGSLSAVLDALLKQARETPGPTKSVVGRVRFPAGDAGLRRGGKEIRELFGRSLARKRQGRPRG